MIKVILGLVGLVILSGLIFGCLQQHQSLAQTASVSDQPVGIRATAISPTSISLSWSPPQNNGGFPITGYKIDYRVVPSTSYTVLATVANVTTYTHTNLITGKTYIYRVSAINVIGTGNPSAEVLAIPNTTLNSTSPSGNTSGITVTTDKSSYNDGDVIKISGTVSNYISNTPVTIRIIDPIGNNVKVDQVDVGSDRTFSTSITATGALWQEGIQTVKVQYSSPDISAQTTFQFSGSSSQSGNTIKVDGTDLSVKYSITNGKVLGIKEDIQSNSLIVSIQTTGNGVLTVTLPRALINATLPTGQDDKYHVLVDNQEENNFQETSTTTTDRTLSIPFTDGTGQIKIIGTLDSSANHTSGNPASTIAVTTDKTSYSSGDTIRIFGTVSGYISNVPMTIRISDPRGNIIELDQANVESDRTFSATVTDTTGVTWQQAGTYSVKVTYGRPDIVAQTIFQFSGSSGSPSGPPTTAITVITDKLVYDHNSQIIITGHVVDPILGQDAHLKITSPSGNVVTAAQVTTDNNGYFVTHVSTSGNLWFENGQYTLAVQQGDNQTRFYSTVFQISGVGPAIASPPQSTYTPMTPVLVPTQQDIESINQAKNNQTIAAEINVGNDKTETRSIDSGVTVQTTSTTQDSLGVTVNASSQTGPKVIVLNLNATTINVSNLKDLGVTYDGKSISPAPNMDAILHAKSTDNPSFAIVVTQSGVQVLVLVPHFSEHTITITNMSKVISVVPEFGPIVGIVSVVSIIAGMISPRFFKA